MRDFSSIIPIGWSNSSLMRIGLLLSVPLIAWARLVSKLTTDWSTNAQYEFGYFVPIFILYLLGRRWSSRPNPAVFRPVRGAACIGLMLVILLLPMRILQEANPDWRPFNWFHALVILILSLVPFMMVGGASWARHFAFPFMLIFSALPWPLAVEQTVLQWLSGVVTTATVELLNLINIPALQRGNVIDIAAGSVGIADACSGIRSLAGTLMASLFFGEFYRLKLERRIALVAGGCIIAFSLNLLRAFFLSWRAASEGIHSIEKWHDPAGFTIFAFSFASLWLLANWMAQGGETPDTQPNEKGVILPFFGVGLVLPGVVWVLCIPFMSDSWYKNREGVRPTAIEWDLRWPAPSAVFRFEEVPSETRSILRYTNGRSAKFDWSDGSAWHVFFFHWAPGRSSVQLATMHRPEVCLPAVGYKFLTPVPSVDVSIFPVSIPFTGSLFECDGSRVFVYRCLWEDFPMEGLVRNKNFDMSLRGRFLAAWYGRRNLGQRMLQIAMIGMNSEQDARTQLQRKLAKLIQLKS